MTALLAEIETKAQKLNVNEQKKLQTFLFNNLRNSELTYVNNLQLDSELQRVR